MGLEDVYDLNLSVVGLHPTQLHFGRISTPIFCISASQIIIALFINF